MAVEHGLLHCGGMQAQSIENRMVKRISVPKRDEYWEWRRLCNEEVHSFYRSHNTIKIIKSRIRRWAGWDKVGISSNTEKDL